MAITCWHTGTAFIALLQACRIQHLSKSANEDLDILAIAVGELQKMWASANVVAQGFERLRKREPASALGAPLLENGSSLGSSTSQHHSMRGLGTFPVEQSHHTDEDFDWMRFFPFVSKATGGIADSLISGRELGTATRGFPSPDNEVFHDTLLAQYQDLFEPFTDYTLGFPDLMFDTT